MMYGCPVSGCRHEDIHAAILDGSWHDSVIGPTVVMGDLLSPTGRYVKSVLIVKAPPDDDSDSGDE